MTPRWDPREDDILAAGLFAKKSDTPWTVVVLEGFIGDYNIIGDLPQHLSLEYSVFWIKQLCSIWEMISAGPKSCGC